MYTSLRKLKGGQTDMCDICKSFNCFKVLIIKHSQSFWREKAIGVQIRNFLKSSADALLKCI